MNKPYFTPEELRIIKNHVKFIKENLPIVLQYESIEIPEMPNTETCIADEMRAYRDLVSNITEPLNTALYNMGIEINYLQKFRFKHSRIINEILFDKESEERFKSEYQKNFQK